MKLLEVTIKRAHLKEEHEHKLKDFFTASEKEPEDENGKTASWYEDMNLPIPDELKNNVDNELSLPITDEFFEFKTKHSFIPIKNIDYIMGDFEEGAEIILLSGEVIKTIEDEHEIKNRIDKLNNK